MAKDEKKPATKKAADVKSTPAEKGKAKAVDSAQTDGEKKLPIHDKDGKPVKNGEKDDLPKDGDELSEEDAQLKADLEMLVERLQEDDATLYKPSIDAIKTHIKTSTSSMTAVPKPLKFLRPHFETLASIYEKWTAGSDKDSLADTLSVLGMTYGDEDSHETLKYRLLSQSKDEDYGAWGFEYVRHLALEIGKEYNKRLEEDKDVQDLTQLATTLIPYFLKHNAEADAVDLLSELEMIEELPQYLDKDTYSRTCLYMSSMVNLLTYPEDQQFLRTAHDIYKEYDKPAQAMVLAIRMNDMEVIKQDLLDCADPQMKQQLALMLGRQRIYFDLEEEDSLDEDEKQDLQECMGNVHLHRHFKTVAKDLNILEPKAPEDYYKSHLEGGRNTGPPVASAKGGLADAFVNAFINAGFGDDKFMTPAGATSYVYGTKDDGQASAAASLGLIGLWDIEGGLDKIDRYKSMKSQTIKDGADLAYGITGAGVRIESDPIVSLLADEDTLQKGAPSTRMAAIMGLGLANAGSARNDLLEALLPIVQDSSIDISLSAMAAVALGFIFVGTSNGEITEAIAMTFLDDDRQKQLKDKWARFLALGAALVFLGRQEEVEVVLELLRAVEHPMAKPTATLASVCAYAGTGSVLKLQEMLHVCNDHIEDSKDDKSTDETVAEIKSNQLVQSYAVIGLALISMGEDVGQDMILRQFGHLMHYGEPNIRKVVPLAMGLISPSNPQMKIYDTLSRYSHDNDNDVAINAIFAMGLVGAGTNNARLAQLLRSLASYYHRDPNSLFMVRIAQGLLHMGKGSMTINPFHTERQIFSPVAAAGLLTVLISLVDAKQFILAEAHYLLYFLVTAMYPRFLITLDQQLRPMSVSVRVGQAVDVVGQAGRPKTITGWQTQTTPVFLQYGERAELEDDEYINLNSCLEGLCILKKASVSTTSPECTLT